MGIEFLAQQNGHRAAHTRNLSAGQFHDEGGSLIGCLGQTGDVLAFEKRSQVWGEDVGWQWVATPNLIHWVCWLIQLDKSPSREQSAPFVPVLVQLSGSLRYVDNFGEP